MPEWYANLIWPAALGSDANGDEYLQQPDFPDNNWALWRSEVSTELEARLRGCGCEALLAWAAWAGQPMNDAKEPLWVSPDAIILAVACVRRLMENPADCALLLADYEDYGDRGRPKDVQFLEDLAVVEQKARWAKEHDKALVTFNFDNSSAN